MGDIEKFFNDARGVLEDLVGSSISALRPDNNNLFGNFKSTSLDENHRDMNTNLIGVKKKEESVSEYECGDKINKTKIDFGDSAHHTGFLAFLNSDVDKENLPLYEVKGKPGFMYRHPTQAPWNNWKNCTRDQLLAFAAGCWRAKKYDIVERLLDEHNKRPNAVGLPLCQNSEKDCPMTQKQFYETDILTPVDVMFLKICAGNFEAYKDPIGQLNLQIAIEVTDKNDISKEKNQLILQAIVCGRLDLYVEVHDNYKENIRYYWGDRPDGGGQHMPDIGEAFIRAIEQELQRYSEQPRPKRLGIPYNTLKEVLPAIFAGLIGGPAFSTLLLVLNSEKLIKALTTDLQVFGKEIENYFSDVLKNPLNIINIPFMPFNPVAQIISGLFNKTDLSVVYNRLNYLQGEIDTLKKRVEELVKMVHELPEIIINRMYSQQILLGIEKYKKTCNKFNENLSKGVSLEVVQNDFSDDFKNIHNTFYDNLLFYETKPEEFYKIPFIISCMNIHISTLSMSGKSPSYIGSIVKEYRNEVNKILNDSSVSSIKNQIESLVAIQVQNIINLKSLYTYIFKIEYEESMESYGKKLPPHFDPAEYPSWELSGTIKKMDYNFVEYYESDKINSLKELFDNPIITFSPELLPKKLEKVINQNGTFVYSGTYGKPTTFTTTIQLGDFEVLIKPSINSVWIASGKQKGVEFIYPPENVAFIDSIIQKNINDGEKLVNAGIILLDGLKELEKIDEIIKTCDELIAVK